VKKIYFILLSFFLFQYGIGQSTINGYEYWFDNDYTNKTSTNITPVAQLNFNQNVNTSGLANGLHTFNFRAIDQDGMWSSPLTHYFYKLPIVNNVANPKIVAYEYWLDNNYASAIQANTPNQEQVVINNLLSMSSLPDGLHQLNIRFKDENGMWSSPLTHAFYKLPIVNNVANPKIVAYEYWLDNNYASAIQTNTPNQQQVVLNDLISMSSAVNGLHQFNIRFKDENGLWSSPLTHVFYKLENNTVVLNPKLKTYRYWFDDDFANVQTIDLATMVESYQWNELLPMPANMPGGTHAINVQFKDSIGLWSSPLEHEFDKNFDPRGNLNASSLSVCGSEPITFSPTTIDVDSIYWNFGDGTLVIGKLFNETISHSFSQAGTYNIQSVIKHISSGLTNTITTQITVYPVYETLPPVDVTICPSELPYHFGTQELSANGTYSELFQTIHGCDSLATINFTILPVSNGIDTQIACGSYTWMDGVTYTSSINTPTFTIVGGSANGCDSVVTLNLTIKPIPSAAVTQVGIILTANESGATYQWIDCATNQLIAGAITQSFTATENGNYAVIVTKDGCDVASNCYAVTTVGLYELAYSNLVVYPNPNQGRFTIDFGKYVDEASYAIVDLNGAIVLDGKIYHSTSTVIDVNAVPGIYFLTVLNNGLKEIVKIIVE
jgi:hypothetical protein